MASAISMLGAAVVPGYYLVCYNALTTACLGTVAVVPGYYLVCYNLEEVKLIALAAVVPGYYLVCYNIVIASCSFK